MEGQCPGPPVPKACTGLDGCFYNGFPCPLLKEPCGSARDGVDVQGMAGGVGAAGTRYLHAVQLVARVKVLYTPDLPLGKELDERLRGHGFEHVGGRDVEQALHNFRKVLVQALVDKTAEKGRGLEQAFHVWIRAARGKQGKDSSSK